MKFKDEIIRNLNESENIINTVINLINKGSITPEDAINKLQVAKTKILAATDRVELN